MRGSACLTRSGYFVVFEQIAATGGVLKAS
jgi:hypothetical protein